jgi:hypothetical protein
MRFGPGCLLALSCLLPASAGCGPRAGAAPAAARPAARPAPHEPSRPEPPAEPAYEVKRVQAFASPERCSQGPLDLEVAALGAAPAERLVVVACTPRDVAGRYEIGTDGWRMQSMYGWDKSDNSRCAAKPGEVKASTASKAEPTAVPGKGKPGKAARKGKKDEPAPAPKPTPVPWTADRACPRTVHVADNVWKAQPLRAGQLIRIRLWSEVPNDFEGVVFVVKQLALGPKVTPDAWQEYLRRADAYDQAYRAYVDKLPTCGTDAAKGKSCVHPREETRAKFDIPLPPPPRATRKPPRPSANAEWVPGYWHWAGTAWAWLGGWWRVPEADVAGNLTARAPAAPPAARLEPRAPAPAAGAVFIPGHWMWSEGSWVWGEGGWRLPPGPGYRWHPPEWRRVPSGFVFIPGQWVR